MPATWTPCFHAVSVHVAVVPPIAAGTVTL
jgi:hypothetical protein